MPEGPEIRRAADKIAAVLEGERIELAEFTQHHLAPYGDLLRGSTVERVAPASKAMLTQFSNGLTLYSHNQLYGVWYVVKRDKPPKTKRTLRVALHTQTHSALLYSASDIEVMRTEDVAAHAYVAKLGPDPLAEHTKPRDILARLRDRRFTGRRLSSLYLDQGFVAGIGNYLRTEILFFAGLDPSLRPKDLDGAAQRRLARLTISVTRRAYRTAGITNSPDRVKRLKQAGATRSRYRFAAFARAGEPCYQCGTTITRSTLQSRRIYTCATCQPSTS